MEKTGLPIAAEIAVVGAGAAGMMAAIAAAEASGLDRPGAVVRGVGSLPAAAGRNHAPRRLLVLEQLGKPGAKLLATGGGRCNLTNTLEAREFMARFGRGRQFIRHAIAALDGEALRTFFRGLGVETVCPDGMAVYPATQSAATVQRALYDRCLELGVQFRFGAVVKDLWVDGGVLRGLAMDGGRIDAPRVIVAAGGRSYPSLGGTGGGYELARRGGHTIVPLTPALVDLKTRETWPRECAGISLSPARVRIDLPGAAKTGITGDVLFTHEGLSGPAVLDLSSDVGEFLEDAETHRETDAETRRHGDAERSDVPIRLEMLPGTTPAQWRTRLEEWRQRQGPRTVRSLVGESLPARLAGVICDLAGVGPGAKAAHLGGRERHQLVNLLPGVRLTVVGTGGFDSAMVTRGGVDVREVDGRTMQSRRLRGLYFAGEVLDVDGPCGGFNLQWAFSSGRLAGLSAAHS